MFIHEHRSVGLVVHGDLTVTFALLDQDAFVIGRADFFEEVFLSVDNQFFDARRCLRRAMLLSAALAR